MRSGGASTSLTAATRARNFLWDGMRLVQETYHDRQGEEALTYLYESSSYAPLALADHHPPAANHAEVRDAVYYFHWARAQTGHSSRADEICEGRLPRALSNACPHASSCTHGLRTRAGIEQRLTSRARHFVGSILHRFGRSGWYLLRRGIRLHHNLLGCPINSEFSILFARAAISRLRPDTPAPRPVARRRPCGDRRISSAP
jgi:hypothetical protein